MNSSNESAKKITSFSAAVVPNSEEMPRHIQVRDGIMAAIRAGEFAPGERLPGEREWATRFGVSHMTARRAVGQLVEMDLLERRPQIGTYVRSRGSKRLASVTVNLIYPLQAFGFIEQFVQSFLVGLEKRGWHHHAIHLQSGRESAVLRALATNEPAIIVPPETGFNPRMEAALMTAQGRVILIGNRLPASAATSIMADDARAIRLLMKHLQSAGHRKIAIISKQPTHTVDKVQIATWKACCAAYATPRELRNRLIHVEVRRDVPEAVSMRAAVRDYLASPGADATALICLTDTCALGTLAACRELGRAVPAQMSVVASCNTTLLEMINPPVTCADVHIERHVERALELIEATLAGNRTSANEELIAPTLVIRESVAPLIGEPGQAVNNGII